MMFKDNLRRFREKAGFKQAKEFAKAADIPYPSYSAYENGRWPNEKNLTKIAKTLKISIDDLVGYDPEQPDEMERITDDLTSIGFPVSHPLLFPDVLPQYEIDVGWEFPIIVTADELKKLYQTYQNALAKNITREKRATFSETLLAYLPSGSLVRPLLKRLQKNSRIKTKKNKV